mmetsp:Transcript_20481/g.48588  ORF Transcript_20481/g.48588 Transcript_20481/m.48588 type:complete len:270 (+) Transcript_20481:66-875(+)
MAAHSWVVPGRMRDWELEQEDIDITYGGSSSSSSGRPTSLVQFGPRNPPPQQPKHATDLNLIGQPLGMCRGQMDEPMGWDGSGFCSYSARDWHQQGVCVMLSKQFREMSKFEDGLDIAGVSGYTEGRGKRHWCLPVWALAAVAERDPKGLEDLSLDCLNTNSHVRDILRQNFLLQGPNKTYLTEPAVKLLEERCTPEGILRAEQKKRDREKWMQHEMKCIKKKYKIGKQDITGWWDEDEHKCYEGFYDHNGIWNPFYMAGGWKIWCSVM